MKRELLPFYILHSAFCISLSLSATGAAPADLPAAWPEGRYESMIRTSPFALATPVTPVAAPGFASNLYLTGLAKVGDKDFVTIAYRDQQSRFSLLAGEQSADGVALVSVEWSDVVGKSKVTVKKGTEFSTLGFDEATLQKPAQLTPQTPQQMPQMPQLPQTGQPSQRRVVPARTNQPLQQIPGQPNPQIRPGTNVPQRAPVIVPPTAVQPGQANDARRRIRIINSKPE